MTGKVNLKQTQNITINDSVIDSNSDELVLNFCPIRFETDNSNISLTDFLDTPLCYLSEIRDFDGNDLGQSKSWKSMGAIDVDGDRDLEYIYVNATLGRWATVGADITGVVDFTNYGQGGDTRIVGIYQDPLVANGQIEPGSPFDSEQRFQNDLSNNNLTLLDGDDYDGDDLQELYFRVNDGSSVLHAYMHADGNIQYANYQSESDLTQFMTDNAVEASIWENWL